MITVSATQLRKNLDAILLQVAEGKTVTVVHRFREPVVISRLQSSSRRAHAGLDLVLKNGPRRPITLDKHISLKTLYAQSIANKHDIKK